MRATEPTRTREHGTRVTRPTSGAERIAAVRRIVTECQYARIDGCMVDLFSASAIVQVYDALNPENQAKYSGLDVRRMADLAFKIANRKGA
jgi:hypothetical protein